MKKLCLLVLNSFFLLFSLKGQFLPLLENDKHWVFLKHQNNDTGVNILSGFIVNINGDTILNGITYRKLYSYQLKGDNNCQYPPCFTPNFPYEIEEGELYAVLREDVQNGIVYHYDLDQSICQEEYVLFDFQQTVGDLSLIHI